MNFIAGFYFLVYNNEGMAFAMLASMIKSMNISGFYNQHTPLAMSYIYKMNRLLALYFPSLHKKLYANELNALYFSSSWFITSFCHILQYGKDKSIPGLLLEFFDNYLFVYSDLKNL